MVFFFGLYKTLTVCLVDISAASSAFGTAGSSTDAIAVSSGDMEAIELEDVDLDKLTEVNSAIAVEKEIAADTLGSLFASTGNHFFPYVEQSCIQLVPLLGHYYEGIRKSAMNSLLEIARTFYDLGKYPEWQPGSAVVC